MSDVHNEPGVLGDGIGSTAPGHYGVEGSQLTLSETKIALAWNVQGDPAKSAFMCETQQRFGIALPLIPNTMTRGNAWTAVWLGPRSWLLVASTVAAPHPSVADFELAVDAMNACSGALFDLSASRVAYSVSGPLAATVLAKSCPLDFHPRTFPAGHCAQSVLAHANALFCKYDETPTFAVMVARSFAADAWRTLCLSAAQYGYDVK